MNWRLLCKLLGMLSLLVGGSMILSLPWAFPVCGVTETFELRGFLGILASTIISLVLGGVLFWVGRGNHGTVLHKEALAIVGLGWLLAGILGALPFLLARVMATPDTPMTVVDAFFESVSGFTTNARPGADKMVPGGFVPTSQDPRNILGKRCAL